MDANLQVKEEPDAQHLESALALVMQAKDAPAGVDQSGAITSNTSRSSSPPQSGITTPCLKIAPCPPRLRPYIPPANFGAVHAHCIYRSAYPQDRDMDFVKKLKIKSVLTLVDSEPGEGYSQWLASGVQQFRVDIAPNKKGSVSSTDSLCEALLHVLDAANHPIHIHCNQGKHRTGCVVACLRKVQGVPLPAILAEYVDYSSPKQRPGDEALIRDFDPASLYRFVLARGLLGRGGTHPRLGRLDATFIPDVDALALALASPPWLDPAPELLPPSSASSMSDAGLINISAAAAAAVAAAADSTAVPDPAPAPGPASSADVRILDMETRRGPAASGSLPKPPRVAPAPALEAVSS